MNQPIGPGSNEFKEIYDFLRSRLEIPDGVQSFELCLETGDIIRIKNMVYAPRAKNLSQKE